MDEDDQSDHADEGPPSADLEALAAQRLELVDQLREFDQASLAWRGRFPLGSYRLGILILAAHAALLVGGALLMILSPNLKELGIAIVVGAVFGLGSLGGTMWSQQMDRERAFYEWHRSTDDAAYRASLLDEIYDLTLLIDSAERARIDPPLPD